MLSLVVFHIEKNIIVCFLSFIQLPNETPFEYKESTVFQAVISFQVVFL